MKLTLLTTAQKPPPPRKTRAPLSQLEVGERRRAATRAALLNAAFDILGEGHGRTLRIEEVCERAAVVRTTFYNHFDSVEQVLSALAEPLSHEFNVAVHARTRQLPSMVEQVAMGIRLYMHRAAENPKWGWAMVNISAIEPVMGRETNSILVQDLARGMKLGDFKIESLQLATDLVSGISFAGMISILTGKTPKDYPEQITAKVMQMLGVSASTVRRVVNMPLPEI